MNQTGANWTRSTKRPTYAALPDRLSTSIQFLGLESASFFNKGPPLLLTDARSLLGWRYQFREPDVRDRVDEPCPPPNRRQTRPVDWTLRLVLAMESWVAVDPLRDLRKV